MDAKIGCELAQDAYRIGASFLDGVLGKDVGTLPPLPEGSGWKDLEGVEAGIGYPGANGGAFRVLVNDTTHEIVIAFKGSISKMDWKADLNGSNGADIVDKTMTKAADWLRTAKKSKVPGGSTSRSDYKVYTVGHSLGGAEAQTFALQEGISAFVYDTLPVSERWVKGIAADQGFANVQAMIDNYKNVLSQQRIRTIATYSDGEIANWFYKNVQGMVGIHNVYLDDTPTVVPSNVDEKSIDMGGNAAILGALTFGPWGALIIGGLTILGVKGAGHMMGPLKEAIAPYGTDGVGRLIIPGTVQKAPIAPETFNKIDLTLGDPKDPINEITATTSGDEVTISESNGTKGTATISQDGNTPINGTWSNPSGINGTETVYPDGSLKGTTHFASGGFATYQRDPMGNLNIQYFTDGGIEFRDTYIHASGGSGTQLVVQDGTDIQDATHAPSNQLYPNGPTDSRFITSFNADGSSVNVAYDNAGTVLSHSYDSNGNMLHVTRALIYDTVTGGGGVDKWVSNVEKVSNFRDGAKLDNISNPDGSLTSTFTSRNNDISTINWSSYSSHQVLTGDNWTLADGTVGYAALDGNDSNNIAGMTTFANGSFNSFTYVIGGDLTVINYGKSGTKLSKDVLHHDGTQKITVYNADSSYSSYNYDTKGHVTIDMYGADQKLASETTIAAAAVIIPDGNSLYFDMMNTTSETGYYGNGRAIFTSSSGDSLEFNISSDGKKVSVMGISDGSTKSNANWTTGINFYTNSTGGIGALQGNEDLGGGSAYWLGGSSYSATDTKTLQGKVASSSNFQMPPGVTKYYDANQVLSGESFGSQDGAHGYETYSTDGSSTGVIYGIDGSYVKTSDDGHGNYHEEVFDSTGGLTGDDWGTSDGSNGSDTINPDGSSFGSENIAGGGTITYTEDVSGNVTETSKDASGNTTADSSSNVDGTKVLNQYYSSGASIKSTVNNDGTSTVVTKDNTGSSISTLYNASGSKVSDSWTAANGNTGTDTFNSDGTSVGTTANKDGSSSKYTKDAAGNISLTKLDATGTATEIDKIDTSGIVTVIDPKTGIGTSTVSNADTTQTKTTYDGQGNVISKTYSSGGALISDTWSKADGTSGKDQVNPDGSTVKTVVNADKTFSVSTDDGHGNTLVQQYNAQHQLLSDQWSKSVGTHGIDTYSADNSMQKTAYTTDGSYSQINVDAAGNQTVNYYSATGTLVRTSSVATDGSTTSHVQHLATFNAANQLKDGSYSTTSVVNGQSVITFYDANHKVISSTAYSIPTQAQINAGLGGGYGGPLTGNYSIDLNSYFSDGAVGHAHVGLANDTNTGAISLGTDNLTLTNTAVGMATFPSSGNGGPGSTDGSGSHSAPALGDAVSMQYNDLAGHKLWTVFGPDVPSTPVTTKTTITLVPIGQTPPAANSNITDLSGATNNVSNFQTRNVLLNLSSAGGVSAYQAISTTTTTGGGGSSGGADWLPADYAVVTAYKNGTETQIFKQGKLSEDTIVYAGGKYWTTKKYAASGAVVSTKGFLPGDVSTSTSNSSQNYYAGNTLFASIASQAGVGQEYSLVDQQGQTFAMVGNSPNVLSYDGNQYVSPADDPSVYTYSYVTNDGKGDFTQYKYVFNHLTVTTTNADGSVVLGKYDLVTNAGTQTTTWPDGTYSVATNDGKGNYDIINYNSDGTKFSHSWGDATGEKGSEIASSNQTYNDNGIATTLTGVQADNTFIIGNVGSIVVQPAGTKSVVKTSVNYTVPANIKQLVGTGTSDLVLTGGNDDGATITANDANDTLFAGKGVVTMVGGKGNDTFVVNNVADVVQAQGAGNTNTIKTSVSYTAAANVQTLTGTGVADITLTGNGLDNLIQANDGNDTLVAGSGNVTMVAGNGSDTMQGGSGNDTYQLNDHAATLTLGSGQSQVNGGNGNNVVTGNAAGSTTLTLGDGANQVDLSANNSNNTLTLGQGANAIQVGNGNNSVTVGSGNNTITTGTGTNEIYLGTGKNVINNVSGTNHLHFSPDVNGGNLSFTSNGSDIVISEGNTGGTVTLTGANNNPGYPAVPMKFGDGNYVTQLSNGNYQFAAGNGTVQVTGDNGNDNVTLGDGNDFVTLGDGQNTVTLGNGASQIKVGKGNDQITVQNGNNYVTAGNGNDVVTAGSGYNHISVGDGKNTLTTQDTAGVMNIITVGAGSNQITVGAGNNNITAGNGANTLKGGNGTNIVQLGSGANSVNFGDGNNQVTSNDATGITTQIQLGNGANQVTLGNGSDKVTLGDGNNNIKGGTAGGQGNDQITLGAGANIVVLGNGNDSVTTHDKQGTTNHITLGNGKDQITVGDGNNLLTVGSGANTVSMGKGNNQLTMTDVKGVASTITFGDGMNQINFGQGNNQITGGNGNNFLKGGDGANQIKLGSGQTQLTVGNGNNTISTSENAGTQDFFHVGNGNNTINVGQGSDQITVGNGSNTITGGDGQTTINLGSGGNSVTLGNGNDTITGNDASGTVSSITLGNGSNQIRLGSGNDSVKVGNGNNTLTIGAGNNQITLGNGFDTLNLNGGSDQLNLAAGQYTLNSNSAKSAIKLTGTTAAQIRLQNQGGNLIITSTASNLRLTVSNWAGGAAIGSLTSSDGHQWSNADIAKLLQAGQPGAQVPVAMGAGITPSNGLLAPVPKATVSVDTSLHQLISAMGSFAPATAAQTSLADTQPSASLRPVVFAAH